MIQTKLYSAVCESVRWYPGVPVCGNGDIFSISSHRSLFTHGQRDLCSCLHWHRLGDGEPSERIIQHQDNRTQIPRPVRHCRRSVCLDSNETKLAALKPAYSLSVGLFVHESLCYWRSTSSPELTQKRSGSGSGFWFKLFQILNMYVLRPYFRFGTSKTEPDTME